MKDKSIYLTHDELCEMLAVPKESGLVADEYSLIYWPPAKMWRLTLTVGTKDEVEALAE